MLRRSPTPARPPEPADTRAPQYRPAHSTPPPVGRVRSAADEFSVVGSLSASRLTIAKPLLFSRAVPARAARQFVAAAGQVSNAFPTVVTVPLSLVWKRVPNGTDGALPAVCIATR